MRQTDSNPIITVAGDSKEFNPADSTPGLEGATIPSTITVAGGSKEFNPADSPQGLEGATLNGVTGEKQSITGYGEVGPPAVFFGATARVVGAANKSLPKENARLVKQVIGGLAGLTSAACVVSAYIAAEKARKEKHVLNKVLTGAAAAGTAAAALEIVLQSYDLFMEKEQPKLVGGFPPSLCDDPNDPSPGC